LLTNTNTNANRSRNTALTDALNISGEEQVPDPVESTILRAKL